MHVISNKGMVLVVTCALFACGGANRNSTQTPGGAPSSRSADTAASRPTREELAPIEIPISTLRTTRFALALIAACQNVQDEDFSSVKKGQVFAPEPSAAEVERAMKLEIRLADLKKTEKNGTEADQKARAAERTEIEQQLPTYTATVSAYRAKAPGIRGTIAKACAAIRGERDFDEDDVASLRNVRADPDGSETTVIAAARIPRVKEQGAGAASNAAIGTIESYLINGLATFIYNRAKAEALGYVAQRLKKLLCTEAQDFFPNVCVAFDNISNLSLSAMGTYLGSAARKDLARIPDVAMAYGLHGLADPTTHACTNAAGCELLVAGRTGYAYFTEVSRGRRALDVARSLHRVRFTDAQRAQGPTALKVIGLGSLLLDAIMQQQGWTRLKAGIDDLPYFAIAVVFTVDGQPRTDDPAQTWNVTKEILNHKLGGMTIAQAMQALIIKVRDAHDRMEKIVGALEKAREALKKVKTPDGDEEDDISDATKVGLGRKDLAQVASLSLLDIVAASGDLLAAFDPCSASCEPIIARRKKVIDLLQRFVRFGETVISDAGGAEIAVAFVDFADLVLADSPDSRVAKIRATLPVIVQFAKAESSDDVVKVLEAAALPVGSYAAKAEKPMVTLNAFAGVGFGNEYLRGHPKSVAINTFAPVGVHLSIPAWGNAGVLVSLLNLGNLVSARFDKDTQPDMTDSTVTTVSSEQTMKLAEVFSPGVFATKSIGNSPVAFGLGLQVVPSAREVTTTTQLPSGETTTQPDYRPVVQFLLFFGVDVSIFSF